MAARTAISWTDCTFQSNSRLHEGQPRLQKLLCGAGLRSSKGIRVLGSEWRSRDDVDVELESAF